MSNYFTLTIFSSLSIILSKLHVLISHFCRDIIYNRNILKHHTRIFGMESVAQRPSMWKEIAEHSCSQFYARSNWNSATAVKYTHWLAHVSFFNESIGKRAAGCQQSCVYGHSRAWYVWESGYIIAENCGIWNRITKVLQGMSHFLGFRLVESSHLSRSCNGWKRGTKLILE